MSSDSIGAAVANGFDLDTAATSLVVDGDGNVLAASPRALDMFGYAQGEMRGLRLDALLDPSDALPLRNDVENPVWRLRGRRKCGSVFPVGMQARRMEDQGQRTIVVLSDLAPEAGGIEANARLLATASHDLRQPLQTLRLLNQSLAEIAEGREMREIVEHQARAIGAMGDLLDALLDMGKLQSGAVRAQVVDMDLGALFAVLEREFLPLALARGLSLAVDSAPPAVRSDPALLGQVLRNLLGNALKFTERGGVRLAAATAGERVRVTVADTGIGVAQEEIPRLWEDFYRVQRRDGQAVDGFGLGLSIVRRIAELVGAQLSIDSAPGEGTRVHVDLPQGAAAPVAAPRRARRERPRLFAEPRHVLLVEDDTGLRQAMRRWLSSRGLAIEAVGDGRAATEAISRGMSPDLVISDFHLAGGETAFDVIARVRAAAGRDIPALVLSGDTSPAAEATARAAGIGFLLKPVDPEDLVDRIRDLIS
jgi:PAS domain S-box-containing protein